MTGNSLYRKMKEPVEGIIMQSTAAVDMKWVSELKGIMAEGFAPLVDTYRLVAAQSLVDMASALASGDRERLRQLAHSLRGSSSNLGAVQVAALCLGLECCVADTPTTELQDLLTALRQAQSTAAAALQAICHDQ